MPVQVDHGTLPPGIEIGEPTLSATEATVSGPESVVRLVTAAEARVVVQPSGIDVDQTVDLLAVDVRGEVQSPVNVEPSNVHVKISVGSGLKTKSLPVNPMVTGNPADGFEVQSVTVTPPIVSIEGDADALAALAKVDTAPISMSGASANLSRTVPLALPDGVTSVTGDAVTVTINPGADLGEPDVLEPGSSCRVPATIGRTPCRRPRSWSRSAARRRPSTRSIHGPWRSSPTSTASDRASTRSSSRSRCRPTSPSSR